MNAWRVILDGPLSGEANMATDEAMVLAAERGVFRPTLRLYGWSSPTVSIGYLQDGVAFSGKGVPVVRRITGGRAVLHDDEVTYSIVAPSDDPRFSGGILAAYSVISRCIMAALGDFGVPCELSKGKPSGDGGEACFRSPTRFEVTSSGRKLVGSAQRRFKKAFLQHGSIVFGVDRALNSTLFGPDVLERMCWVGLFKTVDRKAFRRALLRRFSEGLGAEFIEGALSAVEEGVRDGLLRGKYTDPGWRIPAAGATPLAPAITDGTAPSPQEGPRARR